MEFTKFYFPFLVDFIQLCSDTPCNCYLKSFFMLKFVLIRIRNHHVVDEDLHKLSLRVVNTINNRR